MSSLLPAGPWAEAGGLAFMSAGALAAFLTIAWLLRAPTVAKRLGLAHPAVQWVGQRSYGFYLYHLPLLVAWQRLIYHVTPATATRRLWLEPLPVLLMMGQLLVLGAALSWHFVEAPLDRLNERLAYRQKPVNTA